MAILLLQLLLTLSAQAELKLLHWRPTGHDFGFVLPQRVGESPLEARERYLSALESNPELREFARPLRRAPAGYLGEYLPSLHPAVAIIANEKEDLAAHSPRVHRFLDPLKGRGAAGMVLPVATSTGLSEAEKKEFRQLVKREFSGLFSLGGRDIDPSLYGNPDPGKLAGKTKFSPDLEELELVRTFLEEDGEGFFAGVCRGHQLGAVAAGCELVLDIQKELGKEHARFVDHRIRLLDDKAGSLTKGLFAGAPEVTVMSNHHQAVKDPGAKNGKVRVTAVAAGQEDIAEVIEHSGGRGFSTQTHPELMPGTEVHERFFDLVYGEIQAAHARKGLAAVPVRVEGASCRLRFARLHPAP